MEKTMRKSVRNGLYAGFIMAAVSLSFGIFELAIEGFYFYNFIFLLLGITIVGVYFFIPTLLVSLIYFYFKEKKK